LFEFYSVDEIDSFDRQNYFSGYDLNVTKVISKNDLNYEHILLIVIKKYYFQRFLLLHFVWSQVLIMVILGL